MIPLICAVLQDAVAPVVEAAPAAAEKAAEGGTLQTVLMLVVPVLGLVITMFLVPWLRKMSQKADAEAQKAGIEKGAALFERVKGYVFRRVSDLIEEEYPKIAADVIAGTLDKDTIKMRLHAIGAGLKAEATAYFKAQGVDLIKEMGDDALDKLIRSAANKLSPFPGKETAVVLAETTISNILVNKGVEWATKKFLAD